MVKDNEKLFYDASQVREEDREMVKDDLDLLRERQLVTKYESEPPIMALAEIEDE